jgi:mannose-6-phosphate isomerase-like protein (cupin superfamily)
MRSFEIVRDAASRLQPFESPAGSAGFSRAVLIDDDRSSHVEIALCRLDPGGHVAGHLHPFEESFYVLAGAALLRIDGARHALRTDDFGFVPVATPHAWSNPHDEPVTWYRIRSPQPRPLGRSNGTLPVKDFRLPDEGQPVDEMDPTIRFVGHFSEADLNAPGPLSMPGYHGHAVRDISVRMMVDDVLGAIHHTHFMIQFAPRKDEGLSGSAHFHDFEEAYFLLQGTGEVVEEGERFTVSAGDLVWQNSGTMHGWVNRGTEPLRFIELQAPRPPYSNAVFFENGWREAAARVLPDGTDVQQD